MGETARIGTITYKIIERKLRYSFRASYIYLDGSKLTFAEVDSVRKVILKKYAGGNSFEDLCDRYTMDKNPNHGAIAFEQGMMVKEFEDAVRDHLNGDIFTVDVPSKAWYYVVKKTADTQAIVTIIAQKINK